jgi:hypothetical protein
MFREVFLVVILGLFAVSALPWNSVEKTSILNSLYGLERPEINPFVVGGSVATSTQFPYQAALRTPAGLFFCGGVIISNVSCCEILLNC